MPDAPPHTPPAVRLVHNDGRPLRVLGDPADQLTLAARLSPAGYRLTDPDTSTPDNQGTPAPAMLAIPDGTPPDVFFRALDSLNHNLEPGTDLLHPVARAADLAAADPGLPDTGRFAVTGYSGHGNMLLQAVLRAIDEQPQGPDDQRPRPARLNRLRDEAEHHSHALRTACVELFEDLANQRGTAFTDYTVAPGQLADCTTRARFADGHTLMLGGLPHAGFLGRDFGAHTFWDDRVARFFPCFGYRRVYFVVRDPLAGLASNAAKTQRPLERVLHDEAWFTHTAKESAAYLEAADGFRDHFTLLRFEDLLNKPVATIRKLANDADGELSEEQAEQIWSDVGFKPVTAAGAEHLVDPLADKRKHFRRVHHELMRDAGLLPWFERFGYAPPNPNDLKDSPLDPEHADANDTPTEKHSTPSTLYGRLNPVTLTTRTLDAPHLHIRATDPGLAKAAKKTVPHRPFRHILRSLGDAFSEGVPCVPRLVS